MTVSEHATRQGRHIHVHRPDGDQIVDITDELPISTIAGSLSDAFTIYQGDAVEMSSGRTNIPTPKESPMTNGPMVGGPRTPLPTGPTAGGVFVPPGMPGPMGSGLEAWRRAAKGTTTLSALPPSVIAMSPVKVGVRSPSTGQIMILDVRG